VLYWLLIYKCISDISLWLTIPQSAVWSELTFFPMFSIFGRESLYSNDTRFARLSFWQEQEEWHEGKDWVGSMGGIILTGEEPIYSKENVCHCFFFFTSQVSHGLGRHEPMSPLWLTARDTMGHKGGCMFICFTRTGTFGIISFVDYSQRVVATSCN